MKSWWLNTFRSSRQYFVEIPPVLMALLFLCPQYAQALDEKAIQAAFSANQWTEVIRILDPGPSGSQKKSEGNGAAYHYYLGTAYLESGLAGKARAHLEKALQLNRRSSAISQNLEVAKVRLSQALGEQKIDPASNVLEVMADRLSKEELRTMIGFLGALTIGLWLRTYSRRKNAKAVFVSGPGIFAGTLFLILLLLFLVERAGRVAPALIVLDASTVRSGPGDSYLELARLDSGAKIRWTQTLNASSGEEWLQVRFSEGGLGWIPRSKVLQL
jgi:tetratricopeptide (TPR) repeat protein